jgi:N-acyl-D-amino-acid deacylase
MLDLVIKNGKVCDGTGNPWFYGDVGVREDRIVKLGHVDPSEVDSAREIDARGMVVCPGFVDVHTHSDASILYYPKADSVVRQGVTTVVNGNCGSSAAPVSPSHYHELKRAFLPGDDAPEFTWTDFAGYLAQVEKTGASVNVASLVGQGSIRRRVMGVESRPPAADEMAQMKRLLRESLEQGAIGMSTGLVYVPGCYSSTAELTDLVSVMQGTPDVVYVSHTRSLNEGLFDAIDEAIALGDVAGCPVQLSHMCPSSPFWGKAQQMLDTFERARKQGREVTADMFTYSYGHNSCFNMVPPWAREVGAERLSQNLRDPAYRQRVKEDTLKYGSARGGSAKRSLIKEGRWELIWICGSNLHPDYNGISMDEIGKMLGKDPYEAMLDITADEPHCDIMAANYTEEDVATIIAHPLMMVASDGKVDAPYGRNVGLEHPRSYGTFVRALGRYVRELGALRLEEAIRKMSSFPAKKMGFSDRGILREGLFADIVVFDPDTVSDRGVIKQPRQYPVGVQYVIVNGVVVISLGEHTGARSGKVLRRCG